jgi:hypothetical protein
MSKKLTAIWNLFLIAVFIVLGSASSAVSQGLRPIPALVKISLRAEGDLQRVETSELAVYAHLTTEDEDYLIAEAKSKATLTNQSSSFGCELRNSWT